MSKINVLMIGSGEYTTGFVHGAVSQSDKGSGVVALTMFDLRRRGYVDRILMAGTRGARFAGIREHLQKRIGDTYRDMVVDFEYFPAEESIDPSAYHQAIAELSPGDVVTVFTPDDTHASITQAAIERNCHVLVAKPIVQHLEDHLRLRDLAKRHNVLVAMEVHKRWDPIYRDARDRIRKLGDFSCFHSFMSQPKSQLDTFRAWAGKSSDISYYLNAHHIDFHAWCMAEHAKPISVFATRATGISLSKGLETEDAISLHVTWQNVESGNLGTATYTASWIAPPSDVHSQQRFSYMGHHGEVSVDQAHRGYTIATDAQGFQSANPLFMKYEPDSDGLFAGQSGYGYRSIEDFVVAARAIRTEVASPRDFRGKLATIEDTTWVTAILQAGRRSLDENRSVTLRYNDQLNQVVGLE